MKRIRQPATLIEMRLPPEKKANTANYPYCLPAVRALDVLPFHPKVTFFIGENGSGKSTLLEALAVALSLNPEGGSANFQFSTRSSHSGLGDDLRLAHTPGWILDRFFLRAESFYNVASEIERLDQGSGQLLNAYGGRSLHEQSHGESFFALFQNRFKGGGLYLLDEPEAALSPTRQMSLLTLIHQLCDAQSQFVIATHSPIILAYPDAWIYSLDEHGIGRVEYRDTEHYKVTHAFLTRTNQMLKVLLGAEGGGDGDW